MKTIRLDENRDIDFYLNRFHWISGTEAKKQSAAVAVHSIMGEYFLNENFGLDVNFLQEHEFSEDAIRYALVKCLGSFGTVLDVKLSRIEVVEDCGNGYGYSGYGDSVYGWGTSSLGNYFGYGGYGYSVYGGPSIISVVPKLIVEIKMEGFTVELILLE
jgi:hypothetical protein